MDALEAVFSVWFLIGAALVFFMQAGFAMVETGFTRAKNAGNIIMKNLMDFCIGTVAFVLLGGGLLLGEDALAGLVGIPTLGLFTDFESFDWSNFVFNLVFCATAATIVSGAMAERTKFISYCIYSFVISLIIYPIEAHWVWGGGWLSKLGFIDFAGSACIHTVGGVCALIGAIFLGARLGKYVRDESGKVTKVNAIQGHSIPLGALGCFILWFGWYGFNGAAAKSITELGQIFATTTVAPAVATCVTLLFTWIKNGKPDVSMCLNASLAGLVAITAGCQSVDIIGTVIIGAVSGILVVVVVELLDLKCHIDDPVGACGVHLTNGIWGTIAAGLFATGTSINGVDGPIYALVHGTDFVEGLKVLGVQFLGIISIITWTAATIIPTFIIINKTIGLRADAEDELKGLDVTEHGLINAYAGFAQAPEALDYGVIRTTGDVPEAEAVTVTHLSESDAVTSTPQTSQASAGAFTKIEIICKERMLDSLKNAMVKIGINGMTVSHVMGCGVQKGKPEYYRGVAVEATLLPKIQVDIVTTSDSVSKAIETAKKTLYTGHIGDGKIFVYDVLNVIKVRTGETGKLALMESELE